jgi:predicted dehydrogenase
MAALAAGKHVLIEKPVALDAESAEEMVRFAERQSLLLLPGHVLRYDAAYHAVKRELESGSFGTIYSLYARRNVPRERFGLHSRTHPVFMALAHDIDIAIWYVRSPVKRVYAMERRTSPEFTNPDIFWGLVEFESGVIAAFETQWTLPNELGQYLDVRLELMTSKGKVTLQYPGDNLAYMMDGKRMVPDVTLWPEIYGISTGTLRNELEYFISVILTGKPHVSIRGEEAVQGIDLANMMIESARTGQPVVPGQPNRKG